MAETNDRLIRLILRRYGALGLHPQDALLLLHLVELGGIVVQVPGAALARRMGITQRRLQGLAASLLSKGFLAITPVLEEGKRQEANIYDLGEFLVACGER